MDVGDEEPARDLPDDPERDWFGAEGTKYARLIRKYRETFPTPQKVLGWIAVAYTLLLLFLDTFGTWEKAMNVELFGAFGPVITLGTLTMWLYLSVNVLRGRTVFGMTPEEHNLVVVHTCAKRAGRKRMRAVRRRARRAFAL